MSFHVKLCLAAGAILALSGCERYAQRPLQSAQIVADVEYRRRLPGLTPSSDGSSGAATFESMPAVQPAEFDFARAVELMTAHSPALKEARAEYDTACALAKVKTPLPNPAFEIGPQYGFGQDVSRLYRLQPFGSLSFAIPTGQRLKRQDEFNCALAGVAWVEIQAKHRELYLKLRKEFSQFALGTARIERRGTIAESAGKSSVLTKRLIELGMATALDSGLIELEQAKLQTEALTAEIDQGSTRADLSQTIGVHGEHFAKLPASPLPALPDSPPPLPELQKILVNNHPDLARLRARYELAERELHLEISKQYPDFKIGPSYDHDVGERKMTLGLTLGMDLPIFDRNQQGIATAKQKREEIRIKYEAAANRALAALDKAYSNFTLSAKKLKLLQTVVLPRANANIDLARKALDAGVTDSLKFLETERSQRGVLIEALDTEVSLRAAFIDLEQAVGYTLVPFPNEKIDQIPALEK